MAIDGARCTYGKVRSLNKPVLGLLGMSEVALDDIAC